MSNTTSVSSFATAYRFSLDTVNRCFSFECEGPLSADMDSVAYYMAYASAWLLPQGYMLIPSTYSHDTIWDRYGVDCYSYGEFTVYPID